MVSVVKANCYKIEWRTNLDGVGMNKIADGYYIDGVIIFIFRN